MSRPSTSLRAALVAAFVWIAPTVGLCRQIAPAAPATPPVPKPPAARVLTADERLRIINDLSPQLSPAELSQLQSLSDRNLLDLRATMFMAPGAAPGGGVGGGARLHTVVIRIHNPTTQPVTLRLDYGTIFCAKEAVTLVPGGMVSHPLCKASARVRIDGNPDTVNPAQIGALSCYLVGRFDNPPRWALDACPS